MGVAVVGEGPGFELLFGLYEDWFMVCVVITAVTCALWGAHLANREALAIHLDAISLLAGTSSLFPPIRSSVLILLLPYSLHNAQPKRILVPIINQLASALLRVRFIEAREGESIGVRDVMVCLNESEGDVVVWEDGVIEDDGVVVMGEVAFAHRPLF